MTVFDWRAALARAAADDAPPAPREGELHARRLGPGRDDELEPVAAERHARPRRRGDERPS